MQVISPTIRLIRAMAIAGLAAALMLATVGANTASARSTARSAPLDPAKVVRFQRTMDRLWQDHVTWTRMVIVSFVAGSPDLQPAVRRLLRNQTDIGSAVKPFYGKAAGNRLTRLLRTHIQLAVPVLQAAKAGDRQALSTALRDWYVNADEIAAFLSSANSTAWPLAEMKMMMRAHLRLTTAETVARLAGHWNADVAAYDRVRAEILAMSAMLAEGIVRQFPTRFD